MNQDDKLRAEAQAFNERISERSRGGFIPDLRRVAKCDYFYKSFWRDPHFVKLYLGEYVKLFLELLRKHGGSGLRILDVGCGAGYTSLELARAGHHVTGIDIAEKAISEAQATLAANPFKDGFGSLEYKVMALESASGQYDAVLFSGVLHHFDSPSTAIVKALDLLVPDGLVICLEPCHESWRLADAAQVALIRGILSMTGLWYETTLSKTLLNRDDLLSYIHDVHTEYVTEQDKHERGQSPNDNAASGAEILQALRQYLLELEYRPGAAFIYRLLGGLRGADETIYPLADFIAAYEQVAVSEGYLRPNHFFFVGKRAQRRC
jgi:2-polyprenyl-3-methyl-5-hydroxy-6-metoxy-1,4-benzoquinol methylase